MREITYKEKEQINEKAIKLKMPSEKKDQSNKGMEAGEKIRLGNKKEIGAR